MNINDKRTKKQRNEYGNDVKSEADLFMSHGLVLR